jgi:hypothetical protein
VFDSVDSKNFGQYLGWECPGPNGEGYTGGPSVRLSVCLSVIEEACCSCFWTDN